MTFNEVLSQTIAMLQQHGRVSYRALKRQFAIDDAFLEDLKSELVEVQQRAIDQDGTVLVWTGDAGAAAAPMPAHSPSSAASPSHQTRTGTTRLHACVSGREDFNVPQCPGRGTQAGHGAVCGPEGLHGTPGRP